VTVSSRPGQLRIRLNAANIMFVADSQRAYSQLVRTGVEPETITDLDIEG
jgi:hypothetical protein